MESNNLERDLICVLFPGIVKNDEKAIKCLGGIRGMSQVYSQPTKKRLTLSYQPDNPYVKKIIADTKKVAGVLLRVKVKKTRVLNEIKKEVISTSVVGRVRTMYKFDSMFDFQYLPVLKGGAGQPHCILEEILPSGTDPFSYITQPGPLFIVPFNFTRSDKPICYTYTDKKYPDKTAQIEQEEIIHNIVRSSRGAPITRFTFNLIDDLATEPHEYYIKLKNSKLSIYPELGTEYDTVKKLFENRPIWSQNRIKYEIKIRSLSLKLILPCLGINMKDGPWRMMWVKFGYDPRKEPESRKYQTLDFRVRHTAGIHSMVSARDPLVHHKKADRMRRVQRKRKEAARRADRDRDADTDRDLDNDRDNDNDNDHDNDDDEPTRALTADDVPEGAVIFRPGMVPAQRQIFYQYCDVEVPEVQELLAVEPPAGYFCHPKRGWLSPNTDQTCRDHIFRHVKETLLTTHQSDLKFEQGGSSDDDQNSDDEVETSMAITELDASSSEAILE